MKHFILTTILILCSSVTFADPFSDTISKVMPSVVIVTAQEKRSSSIIDSIFEEPGSKRGTGFYIDNQLLVTSYHVVSNSESITIQDQNSSLLHTAILIGYDSAVDIAVLSVEHVHSGSLIRWETGPLRVGQDVFAIGHPYGFTFTVTKGIVSFVERRNTQYQFVRYTQSDAAVNSGNSGGPLFNESGNVIGVIQAIISVSGGSNGIALATDPALVRSTVRKILLRGGEIKHPFIGVEGKQTTRGIIVMGVTPQSPAQDSGIEIGDVIVKIDGRDVNTMYQFIDYYNTMFPEDIVTLTIVRQSTTLRFDVILGQLGD